MNELRAVLKLATKDELQQLTNILFCRRLNPIDYFHTPNPLDVQSYDLETWLDMLESRFRFLAADGVTVLKRQTDKVSYRDILIQVCRYLKISYAQQMTTIEIESEIFLNLLQQAWRKLPVSEQKSLKTKVINSLADSTNPEPLPLSLQHDPLKILLQGSTVVAVSSILKPWLLHKIAQEFALHFATYQVAKTTILNGGIATATQLQSYIALQMAKRGIVISTARYTAVRGIFTILVPMLWGYFLVDLGWKAIATNYVRIIPVIFALAQIRLTRGDDWEISPC